MIIPGQEDNVELPLTVPAVERARMLQPEDMGAPILFVAQMPAHACVNQILISPTWNRGYLGTKATPDGAKS